MGRGAVWMQNEAKIAVWAENQLSGRHMGDGPSRGIGSHFIIPYMPPFVNRQIAQNFAEHTFCFYANRRK